MINIFFKEFWVTKDFTIALCFLITMIIYWCKNHFFNKLIYKIIKKTNTSLDDDLYPLVSQLINVLLFGSAIITGLLKLGIDVTSMVTACGVGGLAMALAVKDSIANILAGFILMVDRPFVIGDCIEYQNESMTVLDIGLRRTKFKCNENKDYAILIVRNLDLIKTKIYNYSMAKRIK